MNDKDRAETPVIYSIGHSTHSREDFVAMLRSFGIKILADIRRFPGSRKFPQFDKETLERLLGEHGIRYIHFEALGGRRQARRDSLNTRWRNASFRGYADYMETGAFKAAVAGLESVAQQEPLAYMCAEAVWWRCHRALVSDYLKARDWQVRHIMAAGKAEQHKYTAPARIVNNHVFYDDEGLFNDTQF